MNLERIYIKNIQKRITTECEKALTLVIIKVRVK